MAQHFLTRAILDTVRGLRGYPRLRVLDLSCGRGEILAELQRAGCDGSRKRCALFRHYH